jgi:Flp pilus assembly pilin Flp
MAHPDAVATTAIEYALIAGTISIAILAAVDKIGTQLNTTFANVWAAII